MPILDDERKNELAEAFMNRRKDLYRKSFKLGAYENLKEHLYHNGLFTLGHNLPKQIKDLAHDLGISVIEASDFFKAITDDLSERISKEVRFRKGYHES